MRMLQTARSKYDLPSWVYILGIVLFFICGLFFIYSAFNLFELKLKDNKSIATIESINATRFGIMIRYSFLYDDKVIHHSIHAVSSQMYSRGSKIIVLINSDAKKSFPLADLYGNIIIYLGMAISIWSIAGIGIVKKIKLLRQ